ASPSLSALVSPLSDPLSNSIPGIYTDVGIGVLSAAPSMLPQEYNPVSINTKQNFLKHFNLI
ncbi:hypothetical protein, partial [Phocaeicola sartorii]|uniref:hypothetical protein n=1 Tax=Phocaeicola sartorii TaxID=671267 RepID=UPI0025864F2E